VPPHVVGQGVEPLLRQLGDRPVPGVPRLTATVQEDDGRSFRGTCRFGDQADLAELERDGCVASGRNGGERRQSSGQLDSGPPSVALDLLIEPPWSHDSNRATPRVNIDPVNAHSSEAR